jgi:BlaI family transcriptional regulator, penicillinase repressor
MPSSDRKQPPHPTDAELDILAALWRLGPATVREVHEALAADTGYTTTLKQMQVMTEKGLLDRSERFRSHVYTAHAPKELTQRQVVGELLSRVFNGSAASLVMGALSAQPASRKDLAEIRKMLDVYAKKKGRLS